MPRGGARPGAGRKPGIKEGDGYKRHEPTEAGRKSVEAMAGFGIPEEDIARVIGIGAKTLRAYYADELALGHVKANTRVAQNLFTIATGTGSGAVTAAIFWLKVRAGWSEYAPAPVTTPRPEPLGKKEQAQVASEEAGRGNEWGHLVH
jgi:hypothetical protein